MTLATTLPHRLDRTVLIQAPPAVVFRYFTDSARWARWWGAGSTVDPQPGGKVYIRHPGNVESAGEVIEVVPDSRFVFTYGFVSGKPIPTGSSRVTIELQPAEEGTRLTLTHELDDATARDEHVQGWRFQLSIFANVVAEEVTARAADYADMWFRAWGEPDAIACRAMLAEIADPQLRIRDRFSNLQGIDDLVPHIMAAQRFMPGIRLTRVGDVRTCQGVVLADWKASGIDGRERGSGTNVFVFGPGGRIESVTGFWTLP